MPDDALVMVDRGFSAAGILVPLARDGKNRHWMTRAKSTTQWRVVEHLGKNEDLVELTVSREARQQDPSLPATYLARAITYQVMGFRPQIVLTSMRRPRRLPRCRGRPPLSRALGAGTGLWRNQDRYA